MLVKLVLLLISPLNGLPNPSPLVVLPMTEEKGGSRITSSLKSDARFGPYRFPSRAVNQEPIGFFAVHLIRSDGSRTQLLINESAGFSETFEFEIGPRNSVVDPAGIWTLDIDASGDWDISIR